MGLTINTNVMSLNAQRRLGNAQSDMATTVQRLSSGLRINSAKDDAAGLAISERFTSQIRGLNQAARNANDGLSLMQTAEGALQSVTASLQRIRELAVFDGMTSAGSWLESSENLIRTFYGIQGDGASLDIRFTGFTDGQYGVGAYVQPLGGYDGQGRGLNLVLQVDMADFVPPNMPNGGTTPFYSDRTVGHEMVHAVMARATNWNDISNNHLWFAEGAAEFIHGGEERVRNDVANLGVAAVVTAIGGPTTTSEFYSASYSAVRYMHERIKAAGGTGIKDVLTYLSNNPGSTLNAAIGAASAGAFTNAGDVLTQFGLNGAAFIGSFDLNNADTGAIGGADVDGGMVRDAKAAIPNQGSRSGKNVLQGFTETFENIASSSGAISTKVFQVGANANQTMETRVGAIGLGAMGLRNTLDVTTSAAQTIVSVDRALDYVNSQRAVIGAQSSRLESAISNLQIGSENLSASRGRITDTDFAVETATLARQQILQQAGNAMVVQANQMPQGVLALLRT